MARFHLELNEAKDIKRDERGVAWTWTNGKKIKTFDSAEKFMDYVVKNRKHLLNAVAFSGGAHLTSTANTFIADQLKIEGVL